MTADEKRSIKAHLLLDFAEAKDELDHLKTKAARLSLSLASLAECLKELAAERRIGECSDSYFATRVEKVSAHLQALKPEELKSLTQEIRMREATVAELQRRKQDLKL